MHPDAQLLSCLPLCFQQVAPACGEYIMMVENGGATIFHQFTHGSQGSQIFCFLCQVLPDFIESDQPVEELQVLDFRQVAGEDLIQVMVRVDKARIGDHARSVDHAVCLHIQVRTDLCYQPVFAQQVDLLRH